MYITLSSLTLLFLLYSQFQSTFCYIDIDREHTLTVSRQVKNIQKLYRTTHGWSLKRKRGQDYVPWVSGVHCQRFFRTRVNSRWFEVDGKEGRGSGWMSGWVNSGSTLREDGCDEAARVVGLR